MPNYVYECRCGQVYETSHSIHDDPELKCSNCGSVMTRQFGSPVVHFKGSGFYTNDKT